MAPVIWRAAVIFGVTLWLLVVPAGSEMPGEVSTPSAAVTDSEQAQRARSDQLYRSAQREIQRQDYDSALTLLREYLDYTRSAAHRPERVFWVIDQAGRIYLSEKRDPDAALAFFAEIRGDARLSDLDRAAIDEWILVANEWKEMRQEVSTGLRDPDHLFNRGTRYFKAGKEKIDKGSLAAFAGADFNIASGYLRRFAILYDRHAKIGDVLYMLGAIRHYSQRDQEYWSDNYYLKEVIRRFPHTELAERSFKLLRSEAFGAYAPKPIPADLEEYLSIYGELANRGASPLESP